LKAFLALAAKETQALFVSPIAYAVIAVFLVLNGYTFAATLFLTRQATLTHIFFQAAMQLVLLVTCGNSPRSAGLARWSCC